MCERVGAEVFRFQCSEIGIQLRSDATLGQVEIDEVYDKVYDEVGIW